MSPHPFAHHSRLPKAVVKQVQRAFLNFSSTQEGSDMLKKIPIKEIGIAKIADYLHMDTWGLEEFYMRSNDH